MNRDLSNANESAVEPPTLLQAEGAGYRDSAATTTATTDTAAAPLWSNSAGGSADAAGGPPHGVIPAGDTITRPAETIDMSSANSGIMATEIQGNTMATERHGSWWPSRRSVPTNAHRLGWNDRLPPARHSWSAPDEPLEVRNLTSFRINVTYDGLTQLIHNDALQGNVSEKQFEALKKANKKYSIY